MPKNKVVIEPYEDTAKWLMTFNDLMTLLLTFFVLILSMSSMDAKKVKELQSSLISAIGVLETGKMSENSIIKKLIDIAEMGKRPKLMQTLESAGQETAKEKHKKQDPSALADLLKDLPKAKESANEDILLQQKGFQDISTKEDVYKKLRGILADDYYEPGLKVKKEEERLVLSFSDKVLFASGDARLQQGALQILKKVGTVLQGTSMQITIEGHTDDQLIHSERFSSNWELSVARAVSVAEELIEQSALDPTRIAVAGYADLKPAVANTSAENRAQNRRVEIVLTQ